METFGSCQLIMDGDPMLIIIGAAYFSGEVLSLHSLNMGSIHKH